MQGMVADPLGAAALQLLGRLAAQGSREAAAFLQEHPAAPDGGAYAALAWRGGRRAMLIEDHSLSSGAAAVYIIVSVLLVCFAGMMAGLTLGLLSLDKVDLEVIKRSGTEKQRWLVTQVEPVLARPHYLLATLLLCNAGAMEALPIFLDRLLNPLAAILISVTAILVFGEILPQAVCKKYGLQVGAYLAWPVRFLMFITSPITWPISKLLDWILGEESALFRRQELKALVDIHAEQHEGEEMAALTVDEVQVIQGALDMASKTAESAMTPIEKVFMLSADAVINMQLLHEVINAGHSRVPVYSENRQNILGLILVKELVLVDENAGVRVRDLRLREVPFIRADIPCYDVLKIFRMGRSHMAILTKVTAQLDEPSTHADKPAAGIPRASPGIAAAVKGANDMNGTANGSEGGSAHGPRRMSSTGSQGLPALDRLFVKPSPQPEQPEQPPPAVIGIITIEDVLEELLQAEILDETDQYVDNVQSVPAVRLLTVQHLPPHLRRFLTRSLAAGGTPLSTRRAASTTDSVAPSAAVAMAASAAAAAGAGAEARPASAAAVLQPGGAPQLGGGPGLPRAASAASMSAAAAAGAIVAASALGAGNMPALGAAVGASTVAAGQISAATGGHPLSSPPRPPLPGMRRPQSVSGGLGAGVGSIAAMPIRQARPPANIPRRGGGGSSTSLSLSATKEAELAAASGSPPSNIGGPSSLVAEETELAMLGSPGTSPPA
ncbi:hypothetical protein ABPG75_000872 [Micractinium tetrahymenae]